VYNSRAKERREKERRAANDKSPVALSNRCKCSNERWEVELSGCDPPPPPCICVVFFLYL